MIRYARVASGLLLLSISATGPAAAQQYLISTIVGEAPPPTPAPGLSMTLPALEGIATDAAGDVYFASSNCIFKLDQSGMVTRIAGNSRRGHAGDGGPATEAQLSYSGSLALDPERTTCTSPIRIACAEFRPAESSPPVAGGGASTLPGDFVPATSGALALYDFGGIAVDGSGNLFFAENPTSRRIRKVSPSGIITTVAGGGSSTPADGVVATSAALGVLEPLTVDGSGNLFFGDGFQVFRISSQGILTIMAGTGEIGFAGDGGPATAAQIYHVVSLDVDGSGNLFFSDYNRIRKISPNGVITTVVGQGPNFGGGDGGPATAAGLGDILDVAVDDAGNLLLADESLNNIIRKGVTVDGILSTVAGNGNTSCCFSGDGGPAIDAQLDDVTDVALDGAGNLFLADVGSRRVRKVSPAGVITTVAGDGSPCFTNYVNNCGPAVDGIPATGAHLLQPRGAAVDGAGNLFIADFIASLVRKVSPGGIMTSVKFGFPLRVAVDAAGSLFITTEEGISKVLTDGIISTLAGGDLTGFSGDGGPATNAELDPYDSYWGVGGGLALDGAGDVLIADANNNRVREVFSNGIINTVAGVGDYAFRGDGGPATSAELDEPSGVAFDGAGNLFVADWGNNRIRKISPNGIITTIAGGGSAYPGDGVPATAASLNGPQAIAADGAGNIYIADTSAVRVLRPTSDSVLVEAVVDAASQRANPISPGKIVVLYGAGLGPAQLVQNQPANGQFDTQIGGTTVSFNGIAAPILYASATQAAVVVPYAVTGMSAQVTVSYQGETSAAVSVPVALAAPGIFTLNETGAGQAAAINAADGTVNTAANPVKIGGFISFYATGEGQTSPAGIDGNLGGSTATHPVLPVSATVGGIPATVQFKGGVSGQVAGLMQVNVQIPSGVQPGGYVPVVLQVGNVATAPDAVWITVSGN